MKAFYHFSKKKKPGALPRRRWSQPGNYEVRNSSVIAPGAITYCLESAQGASVHPYHWNIIQYIQINLPGLSICSGKQWDFYSLSGWKPRPINRRHVSHAEDRGEARREERIIQLKCDSEVWTEGQVTWTMILIIYISSWAFYSWWFNLIWLLRPEAVLES